MIEIKMSIFYTTFFSILPLRSQFQIQSEFLLILRTWWMKKRKAILGFIGLMYCPDGLEGFLQIFPNFPCFIVNQETACNDSRFHERKYTFLNCSRNIALTSV